MKRHPVAEPPKDDSEDVPAATTDSPWQASDPDIIMAQVMLVCAILLFVVDCRPKLEGIVN